MIRIEKKKKIKIERQEIEVYNDVNNELICSMALFFMDGKFDRYETNANFDKLGDNVKIEVMAGLKKIIGGKRKNTEIKTEVAYMEE